MNLSRAAVLKMPIEKKNETLYIKCQEMQKDMVDMVQGKVTAWAQVCGDKIPRAKTRVVDVSSIEAIAVVPLHLAVPVEVVAAVAVAAAAVAGAVAVAAAGAVAGVVAGAVVIVART